MELVVLAVPDCPNAPTLLQRLEQVFLTPPPPWTSE